jgi:hypothetical protein
VDNACQRYRNLRRIETGVLAQVSFLKRSVHRAASGWPTSADLRGAPKSSAI